MQPGDWVFVSIPYPTNARFNVQTWSGGTLLYLTLAFNFMFLFLFFSYSLFGSLVSFFGLLILS